MNAFRRHGASGHFGPGGVPFVDAMELGMMAELARVLGGCGRAPQVVRFEQGFTLVETDHSDAAKISAADADGITSAQFEQWVGRCIARSVDVIVAQHGDQWANEALSHSTRNVLVRADSLRGRRVWLHRRWWIDARIGLRDIALSGFPDPLAAGGHLLFDQDDIPERRQSR